MATTRARCEGLPAGSRASLAFLVLLALGGAACAGVERLAYTPDELREELARRSVPREAIVVPHELGREQIELAQRLTLRARNDSEKVMLITEALFDPDDLALHYEEGVTTTAAQTLERHAGNCLGLASVFIGMARAVGLKAFFMDASIRTNETRQSQSDVAVNSGHITAVVQVNERLIGLDFGRLGPIRWYRVIGDVEALGHFYNNRGFERIERAGSEGADAWRAAEKDFRLAVQVTPELGRAWNNLGMAAARHGRPKEAIEAYRRAIAADPSLAAPWNNLGSLHRSLGELGQAESDLQAAARLDPTGPHIQYNLAVVRLERGDRVGAAQAIRRAISLRADYPEAKALLSRMGAEPQN